MGGPGHARLEAAGLVVELLKSQPTEKKIGCAGSAGGWGKGLMGRFQCLVAVHVAAYVLREAWY